MRPWRFETRSEAETEALGRRIGAALPRPFRLGLDGPLGAGKTCLVRGIVAGYSPGAEAEVSSPTYAVCHSYGHGRVIHHLDLYLLADLDDLESVGFWELLDDVVVIEWASRVPEVASELDLAIEIGREGGQARTFEMDVRTDAGRAWVQAFAP